MSALTVSTIMLVTVIIANIIYFCLSVGTERLDGIWWLVDTKQRTSALLEL